MDNSHTEDKDSAQRPLLLTRGISFKFAACVAALLVFTYVALLVWVYRVRAVASASVQGDALARMNGVITTGAILFALGLAAGGAALAFVAAYLARPIRAAALAVREIAEGDGGLSKRIEISSADEAGDIARGFNSFVARLHDIVHGVAGTADQVAATSQDLSAASEESSAISQQIAETMLQVAKGSQDQSAGAAGTAAAVAKLVQAIETVANSTEEQARYVQTASEVVEASGKSLQDVLTILQKVAAVTSDNTRSAEEGAEAVRVVVENTQRIGQSTSEANVRISELSGLSREIRNIVGVIADIATQTNLLALNAAIEAARAGEYGKGFAVVADEVRHLAERSARETKVIGGLIQKTGEAIEKAVAAMDAGSRDVAEGQRLAQGAGDSLDAIFRSASQASEMVSGLIESSKVLQESSATTASAISEIVQIAERNASVVVEMAGSSEEVRRLIDEVAATSEENAAASEEVSASTEEMGKTTAHVAGAAQSLAAMADRLQGLVKRFRI